MEGLASKHNCKDTQCAISALRERVGQGLDDTSAALARDFGKQLLQELFGRLAGLQAPPLKLDCLILPQWQAERDDSSQSLQAASTMVVKE